MPTLSKPGIFRPCGFGEGPDEAPFVKELFATYLGERTPANHFPHDYPEDHLGLVQPRTVRCYGVRPI